MVSRRKPLDKTTARGYGAKHVRLRDQWRKPVAAGRVACWRCGLPIAPNEPWDLGHDDNDRTKYRGPEHTSCNRGAPRRKKATTALDTGRRWW